MVLRGGSRLEHSRPRPRRAWKVREMFVAGLLARAQNPAWRGTVNPWEAMAGLAEPKWLYRLTPMGEALRAAVSLLQ